MRNRDDGCQGSVFSFSFPYRPDPQDNSPQFMQSQKSVIRTVTSTSDISDDDKEEGNDKVNVKNIILNELLHESAKVIPSKPLQSATMSMQPLRILVVDDSPSIVKVAKRFLTEHGHTVDTAENGSEALAKLKKVRACGTGHDSIYYMMLTDIQMPVMDGMECTKRYRQWESEGAIAVAATSALSNGANAGKSEGQSTRRSSRLIIMGMSANNDDEVAREGLAMGMDGFIGKVLSSLLVIPPHHHRFQSTHPLVTEKIHLLFIIVLQPFNYDKLVAKLATIDCHWASVLMAPKA